MDGTAGAAAEGRTVLIVEDDPDVLATLGDALSSEGYRVRLATDGIAALEELQREPPDIVIADVHMPRLDGRQLVQRLRPWNVPVVLLSVDPNPARTPGVVFVSKPFDLDHFLGIVAHLLGENDGDTATGQTA